MFTRIHSLCFVKVLDNLTDLTVPHTRDYDGDILNTKLILMN